MNMKSRPQNIRTSLSVLAAVVLLGAARAEAATITVCAAGCSYNNTQLATALTAASATTNDVILLQEGFTYVGNFTIPVKTGADATHGVTLRTGVNATGTVQATTRYPATGIRICPLGYVQDWFSCATRAPQDMTRIAKIQPSTQNVPGLLFATTATGATPVSYWSFRWLEFIGSTYGGNAIVQVQNLGLNMDTGSTVDMPHNITFDQVVVHGLAKQGQFRGMSADAVNFTLTNSFFYDIKAIGEGQAFWGNGGSNFIITNNYMSGGTEVFFTGGAGTQPEPVLTVAASPAPTATAVGVTGTQTDLWVGKTINFFAAPITVTSITAAADAVVTTATAHNLQVGWEVDFSSTDGCLSGGDGNINLQTAFPRVVSVQSTTVFTVEHNCATPATTGNVRARFQETITNIAGAVLTVTPALPLVPVAGDTINTGMVLNGMTIRYNIFTHPHDWFTTPRIVPLPTGSAAVAATTGGTLAAGTYGYRVLARWKTAQDVWADSGAAAEVTATVASGNTGKVTVTWNAVTNAEEYLVYARTPGAETRWFSAGTTTTFIDTGTDTGSTVSSVDTSASRWLLKNVFELKQGRNITAQYNIIEESWTQGQTGPCVLFTGSMQNNDNWSAVVLDVDFSYNEVRHCNQSGQIAGTDALPNESARSGRINIHHNLFWDIGGDYGGASTNWMYTVGGSPRQWPNRSAFDITFNHNTFGMDTSNDYQSLLYIATCSRDMAPNYGESPTPNFIITNNLGYSGTYGIPSEDPAQACSMIQGRLPATVLGPGSAFHHNVLAGAANCAIYTDDGTNITCPSIADLEALTFAGPILTNRLNYAVKATSPYFGTASDATNYGADIAAINTALIITESGDNSGGGAVTSPLTITTTSPLPTGFTGQPYSLQLTASGGTAPYTWALITGTAPAGLVFDVPSATLSGTPTTAVASRSLTFRVTDATAQTTTKVLSMTVIRYTLRASRYNFSEGAFFVRGLEPLNPLDQVRVGDLWYNAATSTLMKATDLGPPIVWEAAGNPDLTNLNASNLTSGTVPIGRLGASGTPSSTTFLRGDNTWATPSGTGSANIARTYMFNAALANTSNALTIPATASPASMATSSDVLADLTGVTECRFWMRTNAQNAIAWIRYNTDLSNTFTLDLGTATESPQLDMSTPNGSFSVGAWTNIAAGAKTLVRLDIWWRTTSGSSEVATALRNIGLTCR